MCVCVCVCVFVIVQSQKLPSGCASCTTRLGLSRRIYMFSTSFLSLSTLSTSLAILLSPSLSLYLHPSLFLSHPLFSLSILLSLSLPSISFPPSLNPGQHCSKV